MVNKINIKRKLNQKDTELTKMNYCIWLRSQWSNEITRMIHYRNRGNNSKYQLKYFNCQLSRTQEYIKNLESGL